MFPVRVSPTADGRARRNRGAFGCKAFSRWFGTLDKGDAANAFTFVLMCGAIALRSYGYASRDAGIVGKLNRYVLAFGLFGFAGGITNALAVKMLFDRIPGDFLSSRADHEVPPT